MKKARCSDRFLRTCLWSVQGLSEQDQKTLCLQRACQKLRISTCEGCFTDPKVTERYIERCFGMETWLAVWKDVKHAKSVSEKTTLLLSALAYGTTLVDDVVRVNKIFGVDTDVYKYRAHEIEPKLYSRGKRGASGVRNTFACRMTYSWVLHEYDAYCKDCTLHKRDFDEPYLWLSAQVQKFMTSQRALPEFTVLEGNGVKNFVTKPYSMSEVLDLHYKYVSGLYAILCQLVTQRLIPGYKDDAKNALWHNVWYYAVAYFQVKDRYETEYNAIGALELVYLYIAQLFISECGATDLRFDLKGSKLETELLSTPVIEDFMVNALKKHLIRMSGTWLSTVFADARIRQKLFAELSVEERVAAVRSAWRTVGYSSYKVKFNSCENYYARTESGNEIADTRLEYPKTRLSSIVYLDMLSADKDVGVIQTGRNEVLVLDAIDGESLASMLKTIVVNDSAVAVKRRLPLVYIGTGEGIKILVGSADKIDYLRKNIALFDYETLEYLEVPEIAFCVKTDVILSGVMNNIFGEAPTGITELSEPLMKTFFHRSDVCLTYALLCAAEARYLTGEGCAEGLIYVPDAIELAKGNEQLPYPLLQLHEEDVNKNIGYGELYDVSRTRTKPLYMVYTQMDSYYGLSAFGGVELVTDSETGKVCLLKGTSFLSALGLNAEILGGLYDYIGQDRRIWECLDVLRGLPTAEEKGVCPAWDAAVDIMWNHILTHELVIAPVSKHILETKPISEIVGIMERFTWGGYKLENILRLTGLRKM